MWENYRFNEEILQDAVLELENERMALKRTIKSKDVLIHDLKSKISYYNTTYSHDINKPPVEVASVSLTSEPHDYHVVGVSTINNKTVFSYHISKASLVTSKKQLNGILAYLHQRVVEELKNV